MSFGAGVKIDITNVQNTRTIYDLTRSGYFEAPPDGVEDGVCAVEPDDGDDRAAGVRGVVATDVGFALAVVRT